MRSIFLLAVAFASTTALAQPFTYQGELAQAGTPANTPHDFEFRIFATPAGPEQMGDTTTALALPVTNGRFTATINPGPGVFTGLDAWVEIAVRTPGSSYTTLSPRQKITPAPYAARALAEWFGPSPSGPLTNDPTRTRLLLNRSATLTGSEYFGVNALVPDFTFGGMYVSTPGLNSLPYYGYATGNGARGCYHFFQGSTQTWILNNNGDRLVVENTGNVGIGVPVGGITAKLDVAGTTRADTFTYSTPQTRTISIPGAAFRAADSTQPLTSENAASGTYLAASVASGSLLAPLDLPEGSTLQTVTLYVFDNGVGALQLRLFRRPHGQFGSINTFSSPGSVNNGNIQTQSIAPNLQISNALNSYYLQVDCGDWNGTGTSVYSAVVTYSVNGPG